MTAAMEAAMPEQKVGPAAEALQRMVAAQAHQKGSCHADGWGKSRCDDQVACIKLL